MESFIARAEWVRPNRDRSLIAMKKVMLQWLVAGENLSKVQSERSKSGIGELVR